MIDIAPDKFEVEASRRHVNVTGLQTQKLQIELDPFFDSLAQLPTDRCLDLLHVAAGSYAIDRIVKRKYAGNELGIRAIGVNFAVSDPDFWLQRDISAAVMEILEFLSGDAWHVDFKPAKQNDSGDGHQERLPLPRLNNVQQIALYSGGLDSAAGLANKLVNGASNYGLLTIDHQSGLSARCINQRMELEQKLQRPGLPHLLLKVRLTQGKAVRMSSQEKSQRLRAFLFCSLAAVAAKAYGINSIEIFENGVGSINLPPMAGMLFGGLATRGSHPYFLEKMSALSMSATESPVSFSLPFLTMTKGEMVASLRDTGLSTWAQKSRSCVHTSLRVRGRSHCGVCPACIERRQAFAVAGISEDWIYIQDIFSVPPNSGSEAAYFRLYQDEATNWLKRAPHSVSRMGVHLSSTNISQQMWKGVHDLWDRHSEEALTVYVKPQVDASGMQGRTP